MNRPILKLPASRAPKQPTAQHKATTLGEHREAFINANNPKGFPVDEKPEHPESFSAVLRGLLELEFVNKKIIRDAGRKLDELSGGKVKVGRDGPKIISRLLGYAQINDTIEAADEQGRIKNLNYGNKSINLETFGLKDSGYSDQLKLNNADRLEKITYYPLKHKQFMYEYKLLVKQREFDEVIDRLTRSLALVIDRHYPVDDLLDASRFCIRTRRFDRNKARIYVFEFLNKDLTVGFKNVAFINLTIHPDWRERSILAVEEEIHVSPYQDLGEGEEYGAKYPKKAYQQLGEKQREEFRARRLARAIRLREKKG